MLKLYYTTPIEQDRLQDRPDLSLGGFKSGTPVPNAMFNNLFSDISCYSVNNNQDEYIALVLKNETTDPLVNVRLWFNYPAEAQKKIEVAAVELNSGGQMEIVGNPYTRPLYAEFFEADGEVNAVSLGRMGSEGVLGIWFKKTINTSVILDQETDISLYENGNPVPGTEEIEIILAWD